jgi:glycosyltransferase involved in cell wall biosynthesis
MRIVLTNKSTTIAGGEDYVLYLASGLRERKHDIIIAPLRNSELASKSKEQGFETVEMDYSAKGLDEIPLIFDLAKKLKNKKVDIIHTNSNTDRTIGAFTSRLLKCKNIAQIHSHFSITQRIHHSFRNKFIDHFITDSYSSRNQLIHYDKIHENRVSVIHIGIPKNKIEVSEQIKNKLRNDFGLGENNILIGAIGRLVKFKGHIYLIRAFKKIIETHPNIRMMIIGDGEIKDELFYACKELGITDKVFFPGYRTDVDQLLSIFDLYIHPSIDNGGESFPIAVLLALRAGLPVIATRVSDIPLQVKNGYNGFIVDAGNANQLSNKISELIENTEIRKTFGVNSTTHYYENFTLESMVNRMELLYRKIINVGPESVSYKKETIHK